MASPYGHTQVVNVGDNVKVRLREAGRITVKVASTANIADLSAASSTMDGESCANGDIALLKDQDDATENGTYAFSGISGGSGVLTRVPPFASGYEVFPGLEIWVEDGSVNGQLAFRLDNTGDIELGTTELSFNTPDVGSAASLTARISTEESTRASADTSLTARVSTEESTRASADTSLTTRVSTEESTRASAVTSLNTRVSTEESTRASADTSINTRISSLIASIDA